jgi:hypothetical protein
LTINIAVEFLICLVGSRSVHTVTTDKAMTSGTAKPPSDDDAVKAAQRVLQKRIVPFQTFARAVNRSKRSIERWAANGTLPIVMLGRTPYVDLTKAGAPRRTGK